VHPRIHLVHSILSLDRGFGQRLGMLLEVKLSQKGSRVWA